MAESRDGRNQEAHGGGGWPELESPVAPRIPFLSCCFPPEEIVEHWEEFAAYCREMKLEGNRWIR